MVEIGRRLFLVLYPVFGCNTSMARPVQVVDMLLGATKHRYEDVP